MKSYLLHVLLSLDRLLNALVGGHGLETLSGHAGRSAGAGHRWACVLCRVLAWFDRDHCQDAARRDRERAERFLRG